MSDFNSNTTPRRFGRDAQIKTSWGCLCGTMNRFYLVRCSMCNVERIITDNAKKKFQEAKEQH